jgi:hypothetical protein
VSGSGAKFGMPLGEITHSFNDDAVALFNANFDKGLQIAETTGAKEVCSNKGAMPTMHFSNERCAEPDLHHLRTDAARGEEFGEELGGVRRVVHTHRCGRCPPNINHPTRE